MAATPTANFAYNKPAQGDTDWHTTINNDLDALDTDLAQEHNHESGAATHGNTKKLRCQIAAHESARLAIASPREGDMVWQSDTDIFYVYNGAAWVNIGPGNTDLDGADLIIDADGDSYIHESADDVIDLVLAGASGEFAININGAETLTVTDNSLNILAGSYITMGEDTWIGIGAALERILFDGTGNIIAIAGVASIGLGTTTPAADVEISSTAVTNVDIVSDDDNNSADNDIVLRFIENGSVGDPGAAIKMKFMYDEGLDYVSLGHGNNVDLVIDAQHGVHIGDTANANMTIGLTINQAGADNEALCLQSSTDIAHGLTSITETDSFGTFQKQDGDLGGLKIRGIGEDAATTTTLGLHGYGGTANTDKNNSAFGLVHVFATEHDGADTYTDITAEGNVFVVACRRDSANKAVFIVDEDGDVYYDGATHSTFDEYDDAALIRAFAHATGRDTLTDEWDKWVQYNEEDLVRLGILGAPRKKGGLINLTKLNQLFVGAHWQAAKEIAMLKERLSRAEAALLDAGMKLIPQTV